MEKLKHPAKSMGLNPCSNGILKYKVADFNIEDLSPS